jgi:hypothetical protein
MPIHEGRYISIADWRALRDAPPAAPEPVAEEPVEEAPRRRRTSKRDAAAQVMAAMGITPEMTQDTDESEAAPPAEEKE